MTRKQLNEAVCIAQSSISLNTIDDSKLDGFGLPDFKPTYCTIEQVAKLLRWQCINLNGSLDSKMLNDFCYFARTRFLIV